MKKSFTKILALGAIIALPMLSSCMKEDLYNPTSVDNTIKDFDYLTTQNPTLNVDYKVSASVLFHLYSENPMIVNENGKLIVNKNIKPIYSAFTDNTGKFSGKITLPAIINKLFIISNSIGVDNFIEAQLSNETITATATPIQFPKREKSLVKSKAIPTKVGTSGRFFTLGEWTPEGTPIYLYGDENPEKRIDINVEKINDVFTDGRNVSKRYFKANHIDVTKPTNIDLYFVDENAEHKSALLYYCYNTQTEQNLTAEEIKKRAIVAFPCVEKFIDFDHDGAWLGTDYSFALHYFENGVDMGTQFPAGTSIGWIFNVDGFEKPNVVEKNMFYSNPSLNPEASSSIAYERNHIAMFKTQDLVVFGFEDTTNELLKGDGDCNDGVFALKAYPMDAITDGIPDAAPRDPNTVAYTNTYTGTLCYEDNWPLKGDYDMNDVMVKYNCVLSYNYNNALLFSEDEFKIIWSGADYRNSFGIDYGVPQSYAKAEVISAEYEPDFAKEVAGTSNITLLLCKDARSATANNTQTATYKLKNTFNNPMTYYAYLPPYNPFILIKGEVELHLPKKSPSGVKSHPELFGTGDDKSEPSRNIWYRTGGYFPFALNIVGDDDLDFNKPGHEGPNHNIGVTYPEFTKWVDNYGRSYIDWYKKPAK